MGGLHVGEVLRMDSGDTFMLTFSCEYGGMGMVLLPHPTVAELYQFDINRVAELIRGNSATCSLCKWSCAYADGKCWIRIDHFEPMLKAVCFRLGKLEPIRQAAKVLGVECRQGRVEKAAVEVFNYTPKMMLGFGKNKARRIVMEAAGRVSNDFNQIPSDGMEHMEPKPESYVKQLSSRLKPTITPDFVKTAYQGMDLSERSDFDRLNEIASQELSKKSGEAVDMPRQSWTRDEESSYKIYLYERNELKAYQAFATDLLTGERTSRYRSWGGTLARSKEEAREECLKFVINARKQQLEQLNENHGLKMEKSETSDGDQKYQRQERKIRKQGKKSSSVETEVATQGGAELLQEGETREFDGDMHDAACELTEAGCQDAKEDHPEKHAGAAATTT